MRYNFKIVTRSTCAEPPFQQRVREFRDVCLLSFRQTLGTTLTCLVVLFVCSCDSASTSKNALAIAPSSVSTPKEGAERAKSRELQLDSRRPLTWSASAVPLRATAQLLNRSGGIVQVGSAVVFDASLSGREQGTTDSLEYRWDFNGDGNLDTDWMLRNKARWTYENEGEYNAALLVRDGDGATAASVITVRVLGLNASTPVTKMPAESMQLSIKPPHATEVIAGRRVTFDSEVFSTQGVGEDSLQVRWDFDGDGSFDTKWMYRKRGRWIYNKPGSYQVVLAVRDNTGAAVTTATQVQVRGSDRVAIIESDAEKADGLVPDLQVVTVGDLRINKTVIFTRSGAANLVNPEEELRTRWDYDGDGVFDTDWRYRARGRWKYTVSGTYGVVMEIKNSIGTVKSASTTVTIQ